MFAKNWPKTCLGMISIILSIYSVDATASESLSSYKFTYSSSSELVSIKDSCAKKWGSCETNIVDNTTYNIYKNADEQYCYSPLPLGFTFTFSGNDFTCFDPRSNMYVQLLNGPTVDGADSPIAPEYAGQLKCPDFKNILAPLWSDQKVNCRVKRTGTPGNYVMTIEYNRIRWNYQSEKPADGTSMVQVKLYEATGVIQYIYGLQIDKCGDDVTHIGVRNGTGEFIAITPAATPTCSRTTVFDVTTNQFLQSGVVFTFTPNTAVTVPVVATAATNPTKTGFKANWNTVENADNYKLYVATDSEFENPVTGFNPKTLGNMTFKTLTGLAEGTTYYYKVVAVIDGVDSTISNTISLCTLYSAIVGDTESFTEGKPSAWTIVNKDGGTTWMAQTDNGNNGIYPTGNDGHYMSSLSKVGAPGNDWLISPAYTVDAMRGAMLTYKVSNGYQVDGTATKYKHEVMIQEVGTDMWTSIHVDTKVNPTTGFREESVVIPDAYKGKDIQIAFVNNSMNGKAISIDDARVVAPSYITTPITTFTPNQGFEVEFNNPSNTDKKAWIGIFKKGQQLGGADSQSFKYLNNTTMYGSTPIISGKVNFMAPLEEGEYQVVYFTNGYYQYDHSSIIPIKVVASAVATAATNQTKMGFKANWNALENADGYKLFVATDSEFENPVTGFNPKTLGNMTSKTLTGLAEGTTYYYKVVATVDGVDKPASNVITVCTLYSGVIGDTESFTEGKPSAWTVVNKDGGTTWMPQTDDGSNGIYPTGNDGHYMSSLSTTDAPGDDWFISPAYTVDSMRGAMLTYKVSNGYQVDGTVTKYKHEVMVQEVGTDMWTSIHVDTKVNPTTGFREETVMIPDSYKGKDIQIAFVNNSMNGKAISIDDVKVSEPSYISTTMTTFGPGQEFDVTFKNPGAMPNYRIAIFKKSDALTSPAQGTIISSKAVGNTTGGTAMLTTPKELGEYRIVYLLDGEKTFNPVDVIDFTVVEQVIAKPATQQTKTGFMANWKALENANGYKLFVATDEMFTNIVPGFNPKVLGNTTSKAITGLAEGSVYYYKVVATVDGMDRPASNIIMTCTLAVGVIGEVESFTAGLPHTWSVLNKDGGSTWISETNNGSNGTYPTGNDGHYMSSLSMAGAPGNDWLVSPVYLVDAERGAKLTYKVSNGYTNSADINKLKYKVMIKALGSDTWTKLLEESKVNPTTDFRENTINIPDSYKGKDIQIAFVNNSMDGRAISIDDVKVDKKGSISTTDVTFVAGTPIDVTYNNPSNEDNAAWIGIFKDNGQVPSGVNITGSLWYYLNGMHTKPNSPKTSATVMFTAPTTPGKYRVISFLNDGFEFNPADVIYITVTAPTAVVATTATHQTETGFIANWNSSVGADGYKLFVATDSEFESPVTGFNPKVLGNVTTKTLTGLTEGTTYFYKVVATFGDNQTADSNVITVRTLSTSSVGEVESFTSGKPDTWTVVNKDGGSTWMPETNDGSNAFFPTGNDGNYMTSLSATGAPGDDWLISPVYTVDAMRGAKLTYKVCNGFEVPGTESEYKHEVMIKLVGTETWTTIHTDTEVNLTTGFREVNVNLPDSYKGKDVQIAFVNNSKDGKAISIDDVKVAAPSYITTSAITFAPHSRVDVAFVNKNNTSGYAWIAIYPKGSTIGGPAVVASKYLNDATWPSPVAIEEGSVALAAPQHAGAYRVVYFTSESTYDPASIIDITVAESTVATESSESLETTNFTANWTAVEGATSYKLFVSTVSTCDSHFVEGYNPMQLGNVTQVNVERLSSTATYYYKVVAFTGEFEAPASNIIEVKPRVATPAYGITTKLDGNTLSWSVDFEDSVVAYRIEKEVNGKWITLTSVAASGEAGANYQVDVDDSGANYRVVSVDGRGLTQVFGVNNDSVHFVSLNAGWNLISVPVNNADLSKITGTVWGWNGTEYVAVENAQSMQGLWIYSPTAKEVTVTGTLATGSTLSLKKGWNLAGPINNCAAPTGFRIFTWNDSYSQVLKEGGLVRGTGYWFFSKTEQKLDLK